MTPEQTAAVKAYVVANYAANVAAWEYNQIVEKLLTAANPVVKAWSTAVDPKDMDDAPDYTTFDAISAGKRDSWGFLLARSRDFTRNKVRTWIADVWGAATANSNSEKILQAGLVNATQLEVIIGGTTKTTGTVSAIDRTYIGGITVQEVYGMFNA
jgi:hypothetical protein